MASVSANFDSDRDRDGPGPTVSIEPHPSIADCYRLQIADSGTKDGLSAWFTHEGLGRLARTIVDFALTNHIGTPDAPGTIAGPPGSDLEALPF